MDFRMPSWEVGVGEGVGIEVGVGGRHVMVTYVHLT